MPKKFDISKSSNDNNNRDTGNITKLAYSTFSNQSNGGDSHNPNNPVSLPYQKPVNYVPVSNSDCELLSHQVDEVSILGSKHNTD